MTRHSRRAPPGGGGPDRESEATPESRCQAAPGKARRKALAERRIPAGGHRLRQRLRRGRPRLPGASRERPTASALAQLDGPWGARQGGLIGRTGAAKLLNIPPKRQQRKYETRRVAHGPTRTEEDAHRRHPRTCLGIHKPI